MKSDLIAAYAKLTILNAFESEEYKNTLNININNKPVKFERIYSSIKDNETGYQGHIYINTSNSDIIVVHEGSIPLNQMLNKPNEVNKDWYKANIDTLMGVVNKQFEPAEELVDLAKKIAKIESPTGKVIIVGQSLGGTLSELIGALAKNKGIETYTFNSFGAGYLLDDLLAMGKAVSGDYSNIKNLTYSNEFPTKINPHIGNVFKSDYVASKSDGSPYIHNIHVHYINGALTYELDSNYPAIMQHENTAQTIKHAIYRKNPIITLAQNSEFVKEKQNQFVNSLKNANGIKLQTSMDNYIYTVKQGETIQDISNRTGIPYEKLIEVNPWLKDKYSSDGNSIQIRPGDKMSIPLDEINLVETFSCHSVNYNSMTGGAAGISDKFVNPNYIGRNSAEYPETSLGDEELPMSSAKNKFDFFENSMKELMKHTKKFSYDANAGKLDSITLLNRKLDKINKNLESMQQQLDYHEKVVNIYNTPELATFYLYKPVENIIASILEDYCIMEGIEILDI